MLIRFNTAVATSGPAFAEGDLVDWEPAAEARRFVERGQADEATEAEAKGQKLKRYKSPPARPEDAWPPRQPQRKATREAANAR